MVAGLALLAPLLFGACAASAAPAPTEITIHYSRFTPSTVTVPRGRTVTFVLRNDDPIDHEWIVGDAEVHRVHRTGTEQHHESRPTEVTLPALSTRTTTVTFPDAGTLTFVCHVPGHEAYGMVGTVVVR